MSYIDDVQKFGSWKPYSKKDGSRENLSHDYKFMPCDVVTDGAGNILAKPLHRKKDCFARPVRAVRGALERGSPYGPFNAYGEQERGETKCGRCPLFDACVDVANERLNSAPKAKKALDFWWKEAKKATGFVGTNASYVGRLGKLWQDFLAAISSHGGWTTVDPDLIRADDLRRHDEQKQKRRERRAKKKKAKKIIRKFGSEPFSSDVLEALKQEREKRITRLKNMRTFEHAPRWIRSLPDKSCERLAYVWWSKQILEREGTEATGKNIVDVLASEVCMGGSKTQTLQTRVCEDLRHRLPKLENDFGNGPIWEKWNPPNPVKTAPCF